MFALAPTAATAAWRLRPHLVAPVVVAVLAVSTAGCGSSSNASSTSSTSSNTSAAAASKADVAGARAAIAPYTGQPSAFPVTKPLSKPLPAGTKFVFLQASDPIAALFNQLLKPGVKAIGGDYSVINAGATAASAQAAASSALSKKPDAVLIPAFVPSEFGDKLKALTAAGVKVVGAGMINAKPYGVQFVVGDEHLINLYGRLLADWVVAKKRDKAEAVFYNVPELSFTSVERQAFEAELNKRCSSCKVRSVPISVTTFGSSAPKSIANDLQAHPSTNVAVFATESMAQGLPAALNSAGLKVTTVGISPTPENLQDIKNGGLTAGLATSLPVYAWSMVDAGARLVLGQKPAPSEHLAPLQFLEKGDITFDPSKGWAGYPDFAQRFAKLWHP
jgi:ribose transport system substrate-binding protein